MDDLEFRRQAYADPYNENPDFLAKKNESAENANFVDELKLLDKNINDAMHIEPPEGLAERIKLNQTLTDHAHKKNHYRYVFSIAASLLITVSVVFTFVSRLTTDDLSQQLLTHVYGELHHLQEDHQYSVARANAVLSSYGGKFNKEIGSFRYVGTCNIANKAGVHLVLQGKVGPVTVMMMPDKKIAKVIEIADSRFQGRIEPTEKGSYAIIAEKGEKIEDYKYAINNSLKWQF